MTSPTIVLEIQVVQQPIVRRPQITLLWFLALQLKDKIGRSKHSVDVIIIIIKRSKVTGSKNILLILFLAHLDQRS